MKKKIFVHSFIKKNGTFVPQSIANYLLIWPSGRFIEKLEKNMQTNILVEDGAFVIILSLSFHLLV